MTTESAITRNAGRVKDARGRSVTQLDPVAMHLLHQHHVIEADTLRAIASEKGVRMNVAERAALLGGFCGAVLVISLFSYALLTGDIRNAPMAKSAGLIYLCSMPWIVWYGIKRKRFGQVAAAMLRHQRCPHCGYDLRLLPPDPGDRATVCPECGCAWQVADPGVARPGSRDDCESSA
jgi:hypothetical protein